MPGGAVERAPAVVVHPVDVRDSIVIDGVVRTMLSPRELAALWRLPVNTIYRMIRERRIPVLNLSPGEQGGKGDRYRISYRAIRELEDSRDAPIPAGDA